MIVGRGLALALQLLLLAPLAACDGEEAEQDDVASFDRPINGCARETATDRTGMAEVEIRFGAQLGERYEPSCLRIGAGTRLTFRGDFEEHPLAVGLLGEHSENATGDSQESPLRDTESGEVASYSMDRRGSYPYFCDLHAFDGMMGAVFVE